MLHSAWDMETYARTQREERLREAAKAQRLEAAGLGWRLFPAILSQRIKQAISSAQLRFSGQCLTPAPAPVAVSQASVHVTPVEATLATRQTPRVKPIRTAEPYAAMVVVARPAAVPVAERP